MSQFLSLKNIEKSVPVSRQEDKILLKKVNLEIAKNEIVSIVGSKGCGKTTLLNIISGLERQSKGQVILNGRIVEGAGQDRAMVFKQHSFLPWLSSYENIEMVLKKVMPELEPEELQERIEYFISMGKLDTIQDELPRKLGQEMQHRLSIVQALAISPDVVLMDQPFSSLDTLTRHAMQTYLLEVKQQTKSTVIMITDDVDEAVYLSDKIIMMSAIGNHSIQEILEVGLPHPRERVALQSNAHYMHCREKIFRFLYESNGQRDTIKQGETHERIY
ncbi:MAG: hypothetical protein RL113_29 [Pseudomonadota bacterium]|jgi:nitrate/nitrite transport system ATP-binding protein